MCRRAVYRCEVTRRTDNRESRHSRERRTHVFGSIGPGKHVCVTAHMNGDQGDAGRGHLGMTAVMRARRIARGVCGPRRARRLAKIGRHRSAGDTDCQAQGKQSAEHAPEYTLLAAQSSTRLKRRAFATSMCTSPAFVTEVVLALAIRDN